MLLSERRNPLATGSKSIHGRIVRRSRAAFINDPYEAVAVDIAALRANPRFPGGFTVASLVYDVATGKIETVVPPARLRPE